MNINQALNVINALTRLHLVIDALMMEIIAMLFKIFKLLIIFYQKECIATYVVQTNAANCILAVFFFFFFFKNLIKDYLHYKRYK